MTSWKPEDLPLLATFSQVAALLRKYGLDERATDDTVRYRARTDEEWPIGEGKKYSYSPVANATKAMPPGPVLELYEKSPRPAGRRGPDKKPRQPRGEK
ncbi:hypothetical protein [Streptomyces sp. 2133.1]|uniref:hypothetical protein n=1 Tax=Streptomyces sp. 2133.1 TaxID=1881021 RepID=UPI000897020F|nr:hypothetical protein [Streptomyces sp. 2133.1]SEE48519.1 hypothetical protein SAMN05428940_7256 [Streptomyces sp. 2133.1]